MSTARPDGSRSTAGAERRPAAGVRLVGPAGADGAGRPAVVVTGASSGIGLETAGLLAARGFQVFATVRREPVAPPPLQRP